MMHATDSTPSTPTEWMPLTPGIYPPDYSRALPHSNYGALPTDHESGKNVVLLDGSINHEEAFNKASLFVKPHTIYYYKLKKQAWRFGKVLEYIFLHSAVFAGTTIGYSTTCASFVTYLEDAQEMDMEVFEIVYWVTLLAALFVGMADTASYLSYLYKSMNASDADFDKYLKDKYTRLWSGVQKVAFPLEVALGSMSFGSTMSHITGLTSTLDDPRKQQAVLATTAVCFSVAGGLARWLQKTYDRKNTGDDTDIGYSHVGAIASSMSVSIFTITNYIYGVLTNLRRNSHVISDSDRAFIYNWMAIFSALALYYYTRMYYERGIIKKRKEGENVSSCYQRLERIFHTAIENCSPRVACALSTLTNAFSKTAIFTISTATLYGMWSSWRNAAVVAGVVDSSDLTMYPNSLFDLFILLSLGLGNFAVRYARINWVLNQKLLPDDTSAATTSTTKSGYETIV